MIDKYLLVIFVAYCTVIFISALLNRLFYERAWLFAIIVGNAVLAVIMLCGRYIFDLDYEVWRVFLEVILSVGICMVYWFFKGIGDASRTERTVFEDDEYIYYVKAVPKLKIAQKDHNVRDIHMEAEKAKDEDESVPAAPAGKPAEKGEKSSSKRSRKKRDNSSSRRAKKEARKEAKKAASIEAGTVSETGENADASGGPEIKPENREKAVPSGAAELNKEKTSSEGDGTENTKNSE